jgi:polysaccharide deacetylase 2 family uncharacterized protein YibQ
MTVEEDVERRPQAVVAEAASSSHQASQIDASDTTIMLRMSFVAMAPVKMPSNWKQMTPSTVPDRRPRQIVRAVSRTCGSPSSGDEHLAETR